MMRLKKLDAGGLGRQRRASNRIHWRGKPGEIARLVAFLASDHASWITDLAFASYERAQEVHYLGEIVLIDDGALLAPPLWRKAVKATAPPLQAKM